MKMLFRSSTFKKVITVITLTAVTLSMMFFTIPITVNAAGTEYHIQDQDDFNIYKNFTFSPGDSIYFSRGVTYYGQFAPEGSGTASNPIRVLSEGTGALPKIIGASMDEGTVVLHNQEYWEISDLEITGGTKYGVHVYADDNYTYRHIYLNNLNVHDIGGQVANIANNKANGCIVVEGLFNSSTISLSNRDVASIEDVRIIGCTAHDSNWWAGILVTGSLIYLPNSTSPTSIARYNSVRDVLIRDCTVYNVSGDGIATFNTTRATVENCVAHDCGRGPGDTTVNIIGTPVAIWQWYSAQGVVRNCEAYNQKSPGTDGCGFDIDYPSVDCTVEFNYGHDNQGAGVLLCAATTVKGVTNNPNYDYITKNAIVRYNILANNGRYSGTNQQYSQSDFEIAGWDNGVFDKISIYNNTSYWNPAHNEAAIRDNCGNKWIYCHFVQGGGGPAFFKNNIIYSTKPWLINIATKPGTKGPSKGTAALEFDNNLYYYTGGAAAAKWTLYGTSYTGWNNYHAAEREPNSVFADPKFAGSMPGVGERANTNSFMIANDSPAISAGTSIPNSGDRDFFGNEIPLTGLNIGAYQGVPQ